MRVAAVLLAIGMIFVNLPVAVAQNSEIDLLKRKLQWLEKREALKAEIGSLQLRINELTKSLADLDREYADVAKIGATSTASQQPVHAAEPTSRQATAFAASGMPASAPGPAHPLSAGEIEKRLIGRKLSGASFDGRFKFSSFYGKDGTMELVVNPNSAKPILMSGTWKFDGDLLCRRLRDYKCQRIVQDGDRYIWEDQDGAQTSFVEKSALQ